MWASYKNQQHRIVSRGFTIVELLIVIVIIGILAAITIVAYNGVQNRAHTSAVTIDLSSAYKRLLAYQVENSAYPATLSAAGVNETPGGTTYVYTVNNAASPQTFCITGTNSNISYKVSDSISAPVAGGCPGHGVGGVPAITNLAIDPAATVYLSGAVGNVGWRSARWFGSGTTGVYSLVTGAGDGPVAGVTTYARKTWTTAAPSNGATGFDNGIISGLTAGTTYTFSSYLRPSVGGKTSARIQVTWMDNAGATISTVTGTNLSPAAGVWTRISYSGAAPANTVRAAVYSDIYTGTAWQPTEKLEGTALMITEGSTVYNYADGATTNWVWNGATNGSTSTGPPQ